MTLLMVGSALAASGDPQPSSQPDVDITRFVDTLISHDDRATTALLGTFALFLHDDAGRRRCAGAMAGRRWDVPDWFRSLGAGRVSRVLEMSDILGDGDDIFIEITWPTGHQLVAVAYVDHNIGGLKDAFAVPMNLDEMLQHVDPRAAGGDPIFTELDPATGRARVEQAMRFADMLAPFFETDSWPASRPLLRWVLSLMPEGGDVPEPRRWDDEEIATISSEFLQSDFAAALDRRDADLVEDILIYGTERTHRDPFRWGPPRVEVFLVDWAPHVMYASFETLQRLPAVLRAFVRWAHEEIGIPEGRTDETLGAIERWSPRFLRQLRELDGRIEDDWPEDSAAQLRAQGIRAVGSIEALSTLDDVPLPDEELETEGVPGDVEDRVRRIGDLVDVVCDGHFEDVELRTACRRFLVDVAVADPRIFRRRAKDETAAGAVCWVVAKANGLLVSGDTLDMLGLLGLSGPVSGRAGPMLEAIGADRAWYSREPFLGTPRYLTSTRRRQIITWWERSAV